MPMYPDSTVPLHPTRVHGAPCPCFVVHRHFRGSHLLDRRRNSIVHSLVGSETVRSRTGVRLLVVVTVISRRGRWRLLHQLLLRRARGLRIGNVDIPILFGPLSCTLLAGEPLRSRTCQSTYGRRLIRIFHSTASASSSAGGESKDILLDRLQSF